MKYRVYMLYNGEWRWLANYNNYDVESGFMEHDLNRRIYTYFQGGKIGRDNAGMAWTVNGEPVIEIQAL